MKIKVKWNVVKEIKIERMTLWDFSEDYLNHIARGKLTE